MLIIKFIILNIILTLGKDSHHHYHLDFFYNYFKIKFIFTAKFRLINSVHLRNG